MHVQRVCIANNDLVAEFAFNPSNHSNKGIYFTNFKDEYAQALIQGLKCILSVDQSERSPQVEVVCVDSNANSWRFFRSRNGRAVNITKNGSEYAANKNIDAFWEMLSRTGDTSTCAELSAFQFKRNESGFLVATVKDMERLELRAEMEGSETQQLAEMWRRKTGILVPAALAGEAAKELLRLQSVYQSLSGPGTESPKFDKAQNGSIEFLSALETQIRIIEEIKEHLPSATQLTDLGNLSQKRLKLQRRLKDIARSAKGFGIGDEAIRIDGPFIQLYFERHRSIAKHRDWSRLAGILDAHVKRIAKIEATLESHPEKGTWLSRLSGKEDDDGVNLEVKTIIDMARSVLSEINKETKSRVNGAKSLDMKWRREASRRQISPDIGTEKFVDAIDTWGQLLSIQSELMLVERQLEKRLQSIKHIESLLNSWNKLGETTPAHISKNVRELIISAQKIANLHASKRQSHEFVRKHMEELWSYKAIAAHRQAELDRVMERWGDILRQFGLPSLHPKNREVTPLLLQTAAYAERRQLARDRDPTTDLGCWASHFVTVMPHEGNRVAISDLEGLENHLSGWLPDDVTCIVFTGRQMDNELLSQLNLGTVSLTVHREATTLQTNTTPFVGKKTRELIDLLNGRV